MPRVTAVSGFTGWDTGKRMKTGRECSLSADWVRFLWLPGPEEGCHRELQTDVSPSQPRRTV